MAPVQGIRMGAARPSISAVVYFLTYTKAPVPPPLVTVLVCTIYVDGNTPLLNGLKGK